MYFVKSPFWLRWLYPNLLWHESRKEKCIYLTFDDGPIPIVTPFVLKTLKKFNAKATFFCIGDNVHKHAEIFQQILSEGHQVGNHTFGHLNGWKTKNAEYLEDFGRCGKLVKSNLFRPPYGRIKRSQLAGLKAQQPKIKTIMWDVLTYDFDQDLKPETCLKHTLKHTENGSIVVFHDSLKSQERLEYTLPRALAYWTKKGYRFKTW